MSNTHHLNLLISDLAVFLQGGECSKVNYVPFHPIQLEMWQHKGLCNWSHYDDVGHVARISAALPEFSLDPD